MGRRIRKVYTEVSVFSSQDLLTDLIKNVFNTYNFPAEKWKHDYDVPEVSRDFFDKRKKKSQPFDVVCCEKIHDLYDSALHNKMSSKLSADIISTRLNNVLIIRFDANFSHIVIYDNDSQDLKDLKISHWLHIIDKISHYAINTPIFKSKDRKILETEVETSLKDIRNTVKASEPVSEESASEEAVLEKPAPKTAASAVGENNVVSQKRTGKKSHKKKTSVPVSAETVQILMEEQEENYEMANKAEMLSVFKQNMLSQSAAVRKILHLNERFWYGSCLFFLNSSIANVTKFVELYYLNSRININETPMLQFSPFTPDKSDFKTKSDWDEMVLKRSICPCSESENYCIGYNIDKIIFSMTAAESFYTVGSIEQFNNLNKFISSLRPVLIVPENVGDVILQTKIRGYYNLEAKKRVQEFSDNIMFILQNRLIDPIIIRWTYKEEDEDHFDYYAGLMDSIISSENILTEMQIEFLVEYNNMLNKLFDTGRKDIDINTLERKTISSPGFITRTDTEENSTKDKKKKDPDKPQFSWEVDEDDDDYDFEW